MSRPNEGLYLLQDGTHADPSDVSRDKAGVLRHKNGLAVCLYEDGTPQTIGADAERNKNVEAAKAPVSAAEDVEESTSSDAKPSADVADVKPAEQEPSAVKPQAPTRAPARKR